MSDLWTEDEIENRILGTLPMPVHHAMNLRECLYQIQARDERIRELEAWIFQAYKEGYQDAQNDESEGFEGDWEVSMTKMVYDEQREPPR